MSLEATSLLLVGHASRELGVLREAGITAVSVTELGEGADRSYDAVLLHAASRDALSALAARAELPAAAADSALVVLSAVSDAALEAALLRCGVEAIAFEADGSAALVRAIRHAVERKRLECATRNAYATDLSTGLTHEVQLLEHMAHLLALRDREPAPMVLIVLRLEGLAGAASRLGDVAAGILRRKLAVRLRSGLRAGDVVAALGRDAFAVLLGRLEDKADGERVAAKLARVVQQPIMVSGHRCSLGAAVGLAVYPDHGKDARSLLKRASSQAGWVATVGANQYAGRAEMGPQAAANDDQR
jgi:diguanylate cyclase (GGDEF)-like protein